jgi:hypothetical protein
MKKSLLPNQTSRPELVESTYLPIGFEQCNNNLYKMTLLASKIKG